MICERKAYEVVASRGSVERRMGIARTPKAFDVVAGQKKYPIFLESLRRDAQESLELPGNTEIKLSVREMVIFQIVCDLEWCRAIINVKFNKDRAITFSKNEFYFDDKPLCRAKPLQNFTKPPKSLSRKIVSKLGLTPLMDFSEHIGNCLETCSNIALDRSVILCDWHTTRIFCSEHLKDEHLRKEMYIAGNSREVMSEFDPDWIIHPNCLYLINEDEEEEMRDGFF